MFLYPLSSSSIFWQENPMNSVICFHQEAHVSGWLFLAGSQWVAAPYGDCIWGKKKKKDILILSFRPRTELGSSIWRETISSKPLGSWGFSVNKGRKMLASFWPFASFQKVSWLPLCLRRNWIVIVTCLRVDFHPWIFTRGFAHGRRGLIRCCHYSYRCAQWAISAREPGQAGDRVPI